MATALQSFKMVEAEIVTNVVEKDPIDFNILEYLYVVTMDDVLKDPALVS